MKKAGRYAARPWTQADDEKLRALLLTGKKTRAIGIQLDRTETAIRSRASRLNVMTKKISRRKMGKPSRRL